MAIDWDIVSRWREALLRDDTDLLRRALWQSQVDDVDFIWNPGAMAVQGPQNQFLLTYWQAHAERDLPSPGIIDPGLLRPALGYIAIAETSSGGDISYRLFGTRLVDFSGIDLTGQLLSRHPAAPAVVQAMLAAYQAAGRRRQPILWRSRPARRNYLALWERLILPLADANAAVSRFLVGNVPFTTAGPL